MNTPHDISTEKQPIEPIKAPALPFEMKANLIEYRRRLGVVVRVIIGTSHKKPLVSLTSLFWKLEDVDLLIAALTSKGATFEYYEDMVQSAAIAKQFPESVAAYEKHPYLIATGIVIAILAVVVAAVLLFM